MIQVTRQEIRHSAERQVCYLTGSERLLEPMWKRVYPGSEEGQQVDLRAADYSIAPTLVRRVAPLLLEVQLLTRGTHPSGLLHKVLHLGSLAHLQVEGPRCS